MPGDIVYDRLFSDYETDLKLLNLAELFDQELIEYYLASIISQVQNM